MEDAFFRNLEREQIDRFQAEQAKQTARIGLKKASGIDDDATIDRLMELQISPETWVALTLVPLLEVAWADGRLDPKERDAILAAAESHGIDRKSAARELLESWLDKRPNEVLSSTWKACISELVKKMPKEEIADLKVAVFSRARSVAEAAGGFLGIGSRISEKEERILKELDRAFGSPSE